MENLKESYIPSVETFNPIKVVIAIQPGVVPQPTVVTEQPETPKQTVDMELQPETTTQH